MEKKIPCLKILKDVCKEDSSRAICPTFIIPLKCGIFIFHVLS